MTPQERHELADRLEAQASVDHGYHYCNATRADVRAAAAALREMPSTEAVERLTAEVARLREGIERHRQQVGHLGCDANPALWALLDTEGDEG